MLSEYELLHYARSIIESKDLAVTNNLADVLAILIKRYGLGYDRLKTICIIKEKLEDTLNRYDRLLDEIG